MMRWNAIFLGLLLAVTPAAAELLSKIAVVVNDEVITTTEVDHELQKILAAADKTPTEAERAMLWARVRGKMIEDLLVRQRIAELGLKVTDADLDRAIAEIQSQNNLTRDQLEAALAQEGMGWNAYRERMRREILTLRLMQREVYRQVEVTNKEAGDYYQENIDRYRLPATVELKRLTFPIPPGAERMTVVEIRKSALDAQRELREGEPFPAVLEAVIAANAGNGGDMGPVKIDGLNEQFAEVIADLQEGEVSPLIETQSAIHLLVIGPRQSGRLQPFEEVKSVIREILFEQKREQKAKGYIDELRSKAFIDIRD